MLDNCDKIMHLPFNFDACPMHSPFRFVHLMHQNLSARALFYHDSRAKVNTQLLIYKYWEFWCNAMHANTVKFGPFIKHGCQNLINHFTAVIFLSKFHENINSHLFLHRNCLYQYVATWGPIQNWSSLRRTELLFSTVLSFQSEA